ncbi:MAG: hypothetical protein ACXVCY_14940 [Pseudobdellovibrionaceae bacterium]
MKKIILMALVMSSVSSAFAGPGACLDKITDEAGKAILTKSINGQQVNRFGIKKVEADLWMDHPTYRVTLIGINARSANVKAEKDFTFVAQPTEDCQFQLLEFGQ